MALWACQPRRARPEDVAANGKLKVVQVAPQLFRRPLDALIRWLGTSEVGVEACFAVYPRTRGPKAKELTDAMEFLTEVLEAGPVWTAEVMGLARGQGFSERSLRRAKKKLGVVANRGEDGKTWK